MTKSIKTAVIGVGNMGQNHARVLSEISDLIAIADTNQKTGQNIAQKYQAKYYTDYKELLKELKPQAVTIAVPTSQHYEVALYTLNQKIPTLIEKPIAGTLADANQLIKVAQKHNVYLQVGHVERFNPAIKKLKQLIEQKKLGEIINLLAVRVGVVPPKNANSDVALDLSIHDVDIFNYLLNEFPKSKRIHRQKIFNSNLADAASLMLQYRNATGLIQTNWITPIKMRRLYVTGTDGFAEVDYIHQKVTVYEKLLNIKPSGDYFELISKYDTSKKEVYVSRKEPLREELKFFLKNRSHQGPNDIATYAKQALAIIEGAD